MRNIAEMSDYCSKNGFEIIDIGVDGFRAVNREKKRTLIVSWGGGWEHASINGLTTPTWGEMCKLKEMLWHDDEWVVQFHPSKEHYVNNLEHCLHLWKPIEQYVGKMPVPDDILVGIKGIKLD